MVDLVSPLSDDLKLVAITHDETEVYMSTFSFRAECLGDIDEFFDACNQAGISVSAASSKQLEPNLPDAAAEFTTADGVTLRQLVDAASAAPDIYVAVETLRPVPLADNSLERRDVSRLGKDEQHRIAGLRDDLSRNRCRNDEDDYCLGI